MRVLDIGKMLMKQKRINGDTVEVGVFMTEIFNKVAVEYCTMVQYWWKTELK